MGTNKCPMLQIFKIVLWKINPVDYYFSSSLFFLSKKSVHSSSDTYIHQMKGIIPFLLTAAASVNDAQDRFLKKTSEMARAFARLVSRI